MSRRLRVILAFLAAIAVLSGGVFWFAFTSGLQNLAVRGESDLEVASDRLVGQLQRYRGVAVHLSDDPRVLALVTGPLPSAAARLAADDMLREVADKSGSMGLQIVSTGGRVLASSDGDETPVTDQAYFRRALQGALGLDHAFAPGSGTRFFTMAAPIFDPAGPVAGSVVLHVAVEGIEADWRGDALTVFFTDAGGVTFASNRSELILGIRPQREDQNEDQAESPTAADTGSLIAHTSSRIAGFEIWSLKSGPYLPSRAIHLTRSLPQIEMTGEALVDIAPALRLAALQGGFAAAICLVFGAALLLLGNRRDALSLRLAVEAEANAQLETRVMERTAELSAVNTALRREVADRTAAEAALKQAQADLVQAGKLSALGQMSAGISHELNQPLMAISSFAENAEAFMDRDKPDRARQNLGRISELAHQMGRIIRNLRAFARQEVEPIRQVDMNAVVEAVLELSRGRLRSEGVTLQWDTPGTPVLVRGGTVRLQQVVMNLVSNAIDAMADSAERRLTLRLIPGEPVVLEVQDSGPGIAEPERVFDPFYSTKEVGHSEGMGLGLSISYGIITSIGGTIRGRNSPEGGAVFALELEAIRLEHAA